MPDLINLQVCETNFVGYGDDRPSKVSEEWVIRTLKRYGNCFCDKRHNFILITMAVGNITKRPFENGFIVEVAR